MSTTRRRQCQGTCGAAKPMTGFRDGLCEECFLARYERLPPRTLARVVHLLFGSTPSRERTEKVRKVLKI